MKTKSQAVYSVQAVEERRKATAVLIKWLDSQPEVQREWVARQLVLWAWRNMGLRDYSFEFVDQVIPRVPRSCGDQEFREKFRKEEDMERYGVRGNKGGNKGTFWFNRNKVERPLIRSYWVVHTIGAYEEAEANDWDLNGEPDSWLGWAYQCGADGSNFIYFETIRDRHTNDPLPNPPTPVDVGTLENRVVFHETLHRFLGYHGGDPGTGVAEGVMVYNVAIYGTPQENELTPRQIRVIDQRDYPR